MASRAALLLCASVLLAAAACAQANDVVVGGADHGWKVPVQPDALNLWSSVHRFQVGDNLVFKYDDAADAVLEVTRDDYNRCSTASPLAVHRAAGGGAGRVVVPLPRSGPFYFVGGAPGSCQKGERVVVVVVSEKHSSRAAHGRRGFFAPAAAPSMPEEGPAPAPAPVTGAAAAAAAGTGGKLLLGAALLGAVLVGW